MSIPTTAYPGLPLGPSSKYAPGPGTHVYSSQIHASLAGPVVLTPPRSTPSSSSTKPITPSSHSSNLPTLSIPHLSSAKTNILPQVNSIVLCRVTRLQTRQVTLEILVVDEQVCADSWQGVVRREDVRGWEKDKVVVGEGFRVGDLVRGVVISLGDQSNYYLSTAKNELGVIMATSEEGNTMYPISWKEFQDPVTGRTESRKVAKPF